MHRTTLTLLVVGIIAWSGLALIAMQLASGSAVGFDLELLLQAGRDVAAGRSPYDPALLAGTSPESTSLFYSYPPPVAQSLAIVAGVPSVVMLLGWWVGSMAGLLAVAEGLRRRLAPERSARDLLFGTAALAPLVLPFTVGLLFGNFDVWFPFLYGTMLLAALAPSRNTAVAGGIALAVAALKVHPASIGLWFLARGISSRRGRLPAPAAPSGHERGLEVVAVAVAAGVALIAGSVLVGGVGPWADYALVVRAGSGADIVDPRNAGPAAVFAALVGGDEAVARTLHLVVGVMAVAATVLAAWWRSDPLESFAWAASASLVTLPVTWYHYPSALIPIAIAALLRVPAERRTRVRGLVLTAGVTATLALLALPLLWVAAGLLIAAASASRPGPPILAMPGAR